MPVELPPNAMPGVNEPYVYVFRVLPVPNVMPANVGVALGLVAIVVPSGVLLAVMPVPAVMDLILDNPDNDLLIYI